MLVECCKLVTGGVLRSFPVARYHQTKALLLIATRNDRIIRSQGHIAQYVGVNDRRGISAGVGTQSMFHEKRIATSSVRLTVRKQHVLAGAKRFGVCGGCTENRKLGTAGAHLSHRLECIHESLRSPRARDVSISQQFSIAYSLI